MFSYKAAWHGTCEGLANAGGEGFAKMTLRIEEILTRQPHRRLELKEV